MAAPVRGWATFEQKRIDWYTWDSRTKSLEQVRSRAINTCASFVTGVPIFFFVFLLRRVASSLLGGSVLSLSLFLLRLLFFRLDGEGERESYERARGRSKNRYFESPLQQGRGSSLPRDLAMPIRFSLALRVFEQFSCTEDPAVSSPLSRVENRREKERERRDRLRKTERSLGERERSDSCSSLDRTQHPRNVRSILN